MNFPLFLPFMCVCPLNGKNSFFFMCGAVLLFSRSNAFVTSWESPTTCDLPVSQECVVVKRFFIKSTWVLIASFLALTETPVNGVQSISLMLRMSNTGNVVCVRVMRYTSVYSPRGSMLDRPRQRFRILVLSRQSRRFLVPRVDVPLSLIYIYFVMEYNHNGRKSMEIDVRELTLTGCE